MASGERGEAALQGGEREADGDAPASLALLGASRSARFISSRT